MQRSNLILIGAGGHAQSCIDVIEQLGTYNIIGLVDLPESKNNKIFGYEVIASDKELQKIREHCEYALVSVGQIKSSLIRRDLFQKAKNAGFKMPTIISPSAYVSKRATIGGGSIIMNGAVINAGVCVGENCIVNNLALLDHSTILEDHCHVSTGARLNGEVRVGLGSFIGSGSIVKEGIRIGSECLVGMGVCVDHNLARKKKLTRS